MGIVNTTPDSFSDGGAFFAQNTFSAERAVEHALQLAAEGADILDIGGESSRPGAEAVSEAEELYRVIPVIEGIRQHNAIIRISIDTTKYNVAEAALQAGASIINDISGLQHEPRLAGLAAAHNASLVIMHIQGTPRTMQASPHYADVVGEVMQFLERQIAFARSCGVQHIIADVGIGFGKTLEHNLTLLRHHHEFLRLGVPLLLGISRKSWLGKLLNIDIAHERDTATLAAHLLLLGHGASIIRVHNVRLLHEARRIHAALAQTALTQTALTSAYATQEQAPR
jgi:dihydropteroate synthase